MKRPLVSFEAFIQEAGEAKSRVSPLMILTATANDVVEKSLLQLVRSPVISKGSINNPNVFPQCEELSNDDDFIIFAKKVSKTIKEECCIIYVY